MLKKTKKKNKLITGQRLWPFLTAIAVGFSLLAVRLLDVQMFRSTQFRLQADANRYATRIHPRERGVFLDRFGQPLVSNVPKYFAATSRGLPVDSSLLDPTDALYRMATHSASVGFQLDRRYVYPESTAHVLGYVGSPTERELLENRNLRSTDVVGKVGLEKAFDEQLQGVSKVTTYEVNALGEPQRILHETEQQPGSNIQTTLDPYLSEIAYQALGDQRGSVIITDVQTGAVLSMVSSPTFSSTVMSEREVVPEAELDRKRKIQDFFSHPQKLFFNRSVSGLYPPGSVFKLVTAIAALEKGSMAADTTVTDEGVLTVGEYKYANWYFTQYGGVEGAISLQRALARSNDIYFYKAAEKVGPTDLAEFARLFGFGSVTGISLGGEAAGTVPDPVWKEKTVGEQWFLGNTYHFGIGQGDVLVTPIQISQLLQSVSNKGKICRPHVVEQTSQYGTAESYCSELGFSDENIALVLSGMLDACSSGGTAFPFFPINTIQRDGEAEPFVQLNQGAVACKTGTAEFGAANEQGYRPTHGWFVAAFTPSEVKEELPGTQDRLSASDSAQLADSIEKSKTWGQLFDEWIQHREKFPSMIGVTVVVESDEARPFKEGSRDAAPVAKAIYDWMHGSIRERPVIARDTATPGE